MKRFFIKTYGCAHNQADSEFMAGLLKEAGYGLAGTKKEADLVIINTCTVKDPSEKKFYSELERVDRPLIVAGCVPQADRKNSRLQGYSLIGVKQIQNIVQVADETLKGNIVHLLSHTKDVSLDLPKLRSNPVVEIIPISSGCMGLCTFCKTKQARGGVLSFSEEAIIERVRSSLNDGVKEIWLTSEDTGAYGLDIGTTLPELLRAILKLKRDFRLRLGMCNPEYITKYADELIQVFQDERMFKFMHIPVQSGNDEVLKAMGRPYTVKEFRDGILKLRRGISRLTVSTDLICGFPGETDEQFEDTLKLVKELKFLVLNISKFYPRPRTKAASMRHIPTKIVKERSARLTELDRKNIDNREWLGWEGEVLIDEEGKKGTFVGRNDCYKPVVVKAENLLGEIVKVRIVSVKRDYLIGEIIS